ncbi:Bacterial membrane protein YfhO [Planctomycetes bacterium Pla163]|uniref:Bacterial membrane protein YfhO n=1 Tax=Rohdeia mirabilis TaxID=2528008 RepID=A0A518CZ63_9BACT|nr:Bacterial membrane protein YfhO [Planctomycetes bacterium Pla163]
MTGPSIEVARTSGRARLVHVVAALFALLLPIVVHRQMVTEDVLFYALDHAQLQFPRFVVLCDALQNHGELPHWQHLLYGGSPFHANPEMPTLYPPALLAAAFLDPARAMNLFILAHMAVGALGAFVLASHLWRERLGRPGRGTVAATVCSALFTLNYYTRLENLNLVEYGAAHMLLPWTVLAIEGTLRGRRPGPWAAALALLGGLLATSGGLYVLLFGSLFCALWTVRFGLFDGAAARQRTLRWILPAVVAAGLLALAKFLPYFSWLPSTNRVDAVPEGIASARGLGGNKFALATLWEGLVLRTAQGLGLALFALGLWLGRRNEVVRFLGVVAIVTTFFAAGPFYSWLYALGPPFTLVRTGPDRLWTLVNLAWPVVGALGVGLLVERLPDRVERRFAPAIAFALPLALLPLLLVNRDVFHGIISRPHPVADLVARYKRWPEAARKAGDEWRVWWIGKPTDSPDGETRTLGGKNEQFITTALGAETLGGFLGYIWPRTLERHLYRDGERLLEESERPRRAGVMSARYLVSSLGNAPRREQMVQLDPVGIEGRSLVDNRYARPRVMAPRQVVALFGDDDLRLAYRMLDDVANPIDTTLIAYTAEDRPDAAERALWDLVLCVDGAPRPADVDAVVIETTVDPDEDTWRAIGAALGNEDQPRSAGTLERDGPNRTHVDLDPSDEPRVIVLSETWSTNPGWTVEVDGVATTFRRTDGIVTAIPVPAGAQRVTATYHTPGARTGYVLGLLGLVLACALAVVGRSARSDGAERSTDPPQSD